MFHWFLIILNHPGLVKGHLSLTWKSVFVLLKMGVWNRKWEFAFGNGSSKIGVCFKLRPGQFGFFSLVGLTSVKARSLEDSCKEIGSCKHSTLIPLQRSTRTNSLDIKSATWKNNQSLYTNPYSCHFLDRFAQSGTIAQERLLLTNATYCQISVFHFQTLIFENRLPFSTKKTPIFNSNSDVPSKLLYISTQLF